MATAKPSVASCSTQTRICLRDLFNLILKQRIVDIEISDLYDYLKTEYHTDLLQLNAELAPMVPFLIVNYIKNWKGFKFKQRFLEKQGEFYEIFQSDLHEFIKNFLRFWKTELIKNQCTIKYHFEKHKCQDQAEVEVEEENDDCLNLINIDKTFAPFQLLIKCPPSVLNRIVFTGDDNNVFLKQHVSKFPWKQLRVEELINWPNVEVVFKNCDLIFRRRQVSDYLCHLNFIPDDELTPNDELIEYAELRDKTIERKCYTSNLLREYIKELLDLLNMKELLTKEREEEINTIFNHFILDIKDLNINDSMATNTNVLFKLGKSQYIRNKKIGNPPTVTQLPSDPGYLTVGYCELLVPKIELEMTKFDSYVIQENGPSYFKTIHEIKTFSDGDNNNNLLKEILPEITYKCTFCNKTFDGEQSKSEILLHFQNLHKMEQPIRCVRCEIQLDFPSLARRRWDHECLMAD